MACDFFLGGGEMLSVLSSLFGEEDELDDEVVFLLLERWLSENFLRGGVGDLDLLPDLTCPK